MTRRTSANSGKRIRLSPSAPNSHLRRHGSGRPPQDAATEQPRGNDARRKRRELPDQARLLQIPPGGEEQVLELRFEAVVHLRGPA